MSYSKNAHTDIGGKINHSLLAEKNTQPIAHEEPGLILLLAIWFGLAIGLAEVLVRAIQVFFLHQRIYLSPDVVWMAPLADVVLFVSAGSVLYLAGKAWPRFVSWWTIALILTFLGFLGPLLHMPRLHRYAAVILACGLAVKTARMIVARFDAFRSLVRRTVLPLVVIVALLGLSLTGWRMFETRSAVASLAPILASAPNVLLIVLDTVRAQNLSLYGYEHPTTPQLERLAKNGVVFDRALATSPWTLPSHATMFTGRFPHELSANWLTPLDPTYPTLAESFRANGYSTAGFVANLLYCTYETGLNRGFVRYEDYPVSLGMIVKSSWLSRTITGSLQKIMGNRQELVRKTAVEVNKDFLRWLSYKDKRPFFVFLNYMDAHAPYFPPKPFNTKFGPERTRPRLPFEQWTPQQVQGELDAYDGSIAYLDHQIGLLLDKLYELDLLNNTLLVVTSDHGELFGEHGLFDHGNSLYRQLLHVPLIVSFPSRVPAGRRIREPVTLRDLPATLVDLVGLAESARFPGQSLANYWNGKRYAADPKPALLAEVSKGINMPEWMPVMKGDMKSLVSDGMHYIRNGDGSEELYDFDKDAQEERNLAATEEGRGEREKFRRSLDTIFLPSRPAK